MQPILVAYGSTEGHTRKIAEFIAERLRLRGHRVDLVDTATPAAQQVQPVYLGAILGGSVHQHKYQTSLVHFIKANRAWLNAMPVALFSVSLSAALDDADSRSEVQHSLDEFVADCGLKPVVMRSIAGALKYTEYDYFKRLLMRMIARSHGQSTDTSQDHEYTDWNDVEAFVDEFLGAAGGVGSAKAA
jgi:menaquinone-dependent protoporphyrinogen oxidase